MQGRFVLRHGAGDKYDGHRAELRVGSQFGRNFAAVDAGEIAIHKNQMRTEFSRGLQHTIPPVFLMDGVPARALQYQAPQVRQVDFVIHHEDPV